MHYLVEKTFRQRGFDEDLLQKIDDGRHSVFDNMPQMCNALHCAYNQHKHIIFISDFDMDGISSGTIGYAGLCELGFYVSLYLPDVNEGYGFGPSDIKKIMDKWPDAQVIITGDVGIQCRDGINYAKSIGLEVLITDHHVGSMNIPADVVIDPSVDTSTYVNVLGNSSVCGAYVIWQILFYYANMYCTTEQISAIERLIVFAGLGTVSDVMPMVCENRMAVNESLRILKWLMPSKDVVETYGSFENYVSYPLSGYHDLGISSQYRDVFYGLQAVMWYFRSERKFNRSKIDEDFFGYTLAPMFNSVKRMGGDIGVAFGVFFDRDRAYSNILELDYLNNLRKQLVAEHMAAIPEIDQPFAPFIYLSDAPAGILGLMATQLLNSSGMPTIVVNRTVLSDGRLHGSGRSPENYNFMQAIDRLKIPTDMLSIAGHPYAFGASLSSDSDVLSWIYMRLLADTATGIEETVDPFQTADFIIGSGSDCDVTFDPFTLDDYLHEINTYKPFGHGFFKPSIAIRVTKDDMKDFNWLIMGRSSQHVRYCHIEGLDIVIWNGAGDTYFCRNGFSALGHMQYVEYDGESEIAFVVDNLFDYDMGDESDEN